jgi:hypothetical protein
MMIKTSKNISKSSTTSNQFFSRTFNNEAAAGSTTTGTSRRNTNRYNGNNHPSGRIPCQSSITCGSRWAETEALHRFRYQSHQFDCSVHDFILCTHPSSRDLIAMTNRVLRQSLQYKRHLGIIVTASQLTQAESTAVRQITTSVDVLWCNEKYGHAPHEKPAHSVRIMMENFNSLGATLGNSKIDALNNLCQDFKVDMLCGCKTQANWSMVPQSHCFHNLFGLGTETRSVVAHNTNKHICPNQFGGCAMIAFRSFAPEVTNLGINTTGLGRWCWFCIGSGSKKTRIVLAYQPSNLGSSSAGTTVKDQHLRYFRALGNAHSARTIFFEQLVSQLII